MRFSKRYILDICKIVAFLPILSKTSALKMPSGKVTGGGGFQMGGVVGGDAVADAPHLESLWNAASSNFSSSFHV